MKKLSAAVKDNNTGEIMIVSSEYENKKIFREELNRNGFSVIGRIEDCSENNLRKRLYNKGVRI
jgi:hypothetical protein